MFFGTVHSKELASKHNSRREIVKSTGLSSATGFSEFSDVESLRSISGFKSKNASKMLALPKWASHYPKLTITSSNNLSRRIGKASCVLHTK